MAITNEVFCFKQPICIKVPAATAPASVALNCDMQYRLVHLGVAEDFTTGAVGRVEFVTVPKGGSAVRTADGTGTGGQGDGELVVIANCPGAAEAYIGPGIEAVKLYSGSGNPVVRIEPCPAPRG
jgi:hypothetical protein